MEYTIQWYVHGFVQLSIVEHFHHSVDSPVLYQSSPISSTLGNQKCTFHVCSSAPLDSIQVELYSVSSSLTTFYLLVKSLFSEVHVVEFLSASFFSLSIFKKPFIYFKNVCLCFFPPKIVYVALAALELTV